MRDCRPRRKELIAKNRRHSEVFNLLAAVAPGAVLSTETPRSRAGSRRSVLTPLLPEGVATRSRLSTASHRFEKKLDEFILGNLVVM